ncbi:MAG: cytochrome c biogenesis protein CcdA [Microgenomates group bacterium]|jgi:cytochrome c biogenesis protein CcdA
METILFQTSLIAAFVAGMVALFAPCCITFLLPAYLGGVFKEKEKVLLMTLVFGLGIFVVMLPAVLGVALISKLTFRYHDPIYIAGGIVMLLVSLVTFLGIKLPMPHLPGSVQKEKPDILSVFTLGIFSGITSACCAPVLIGILALTFLSPNFFGALAIGGVYVLGMVTPLLLISLFLNDKMPKFSVLRRPVATITLFGRYTPLILSNLIGSAVFFVTGVLILVLSYKGSLSPDNMEVFTKTITNSAEWVNSLVGNNLALNVVFLIAILIFIYKIVKRA